MGLTYDGITYRSLEEQVRYDAEQVQLLKQADVTINENLQTINTEINGKLTKPTTPTADSAVTMLADGTVGTKLLSEIGGSGGKVYLHKIRATLDTDQGEIYIDITNTSNTSITDGEYLHSYVGYGIVGYYTGVKGSGAVVIYYVIPLNSYGIVGAVVNTENTGTGSFISINDAFTSVVDTVIEL